MSGLPYLRLGYRLCAPTNWCRPRALNDAKGMAAQIVIETGAIPGLGAAKLSCPRCSPY